ncbi:endonuclease [Sporosarcina pasteurii]|uniref:Extracellular deoxyribonuclease n=1 Tax=Sporosarcina pasteurii TaxID=1474 RepID=A0A380BLH0_SPOPA|nr:endonuclease [Sporosarcina pasteurii]MDS9470880.1 endonuclease [Sporosarcina pasteurii]SUJ03132.1 Extracellular deoxyribonuclease precursor [Sporosarcina pasteurii]
MENNGLIQRQLHELECMENCDSEELLAELTRNQRKINTSAELYYNEKLDNFWIEHYYCDISPNSATSTQLLKELQCLVKKTHRYKHPYYISKDQYLYTWVDLQPNGQLKSIYSGIQKNPQKVIEEEFATIQRRSEHYRKLMINQMDTSKNFKRQVQKISNQHKFNAEHVVPQSWFKAREPMKGDLHNLFTCEPKCNSIRSNFPYYEFESKKDSRRTRNHCGLYEMGRFEPEHGKGTAARATLYFLLRYPRKIIKRYRKRINIPLLFRWHGQYPVTNYEKHRNQAIFEIQGNRNPFIDIPDLTKKIGFLEQMKQ